VLQNYSSKIVISDSTTPLNMFVTLKSYL